MKYVKIVALGWLAQCCNLIFYQRKVTLEGNDEVCKSIGAI